MDSFSWLYTVRTQAYTQVTNFNTFPEYKHMADASKTGIFSMPLLKITKIHFQSEKLIAVFLHLR